VVVVTGGSTGIGRSIALALAAEGASVAICARRDGPLRETEAALRATGAQAFASTCDIAGAAALDGFLEAVKSKFGRLDSLVNNASALGSTDDEAGWAASINVDLLASVRATRKVVPWMADAGGGSILFISSIGGLEFVGSPAPYAAAKAAMISYSKTRAMDLAAKNIRVNTIAPGSIEFPGGVWEKARLNKVPRYDAVRNAIPFGRLGLPEEVADVAVFLLSNRARWVTGECICVDGGQHKGNL
jgi:3-oxoacyl-[acyl-carrier protein] reductase